MQGSCLNKLLEQHMHLTSHKNMHCKSLQMTFATDELDNKPSIWSSRNSRAGCASNLHRPFVDKHVPGGGLLVAFLPMAAPKSNVHRVVRPGTSAARHNAKHPGHASDLHVHAYHLGATPDRGALAKSAPLLAPAGKTGQIFCCSSLRYMNSGH